MRKVKTKLFCRASQIPDDLGLALTLISSFGSNVAAIWLATATATATTIAIAIATLHWFGLVGWIGWVRQLQTTINSKQQSTMINKCQQQSPKQTR
jgi:hypothetical protein